MVRRVLPPDLGPSDSFARRHIGPSDADVADMLRVIGAPSLDALIDQTVPADIRLGRPLDLPPAAGERDALAELRAIAARNRAFRSFIGCGYYDCITPPVIQRNVLENPGWYTQYTPYQAEISQGRLEVLLSFQTMVADLTGLPLANASLLDEATAAAEAMTMCRRILRNRRSRFFVADDCHPQTIAVVRTRARPLGIEVEVGPVDEAAPADDWIGALVQYPATDGRLRDYRDLCDRVHQAGGLVVMATDLLALTLLAPPGDIGADVAVGSSQRFGVPLGYGGPHAAFLATRDEHKRHIPGRLVGVSKDAHGRVAYRLALQTREQHIRRDRATSNICTAQVLLAIMAALYACWHGPDGLRRIAVRVRGWTRALAAGLRRLGFDVGSGDVFDTLRVRLPAGEAAHVLARAAARQMNLRDFGDGSVGVSLDETTGRRDVEDLLAAFAGDRAAPAVDELVDGVDAAYAAPFARTSGYLDHPCFHRYHTEHEMLRYLHRLQARDLSLTTSMIPLGSCTMKLNAAAEMVPITWPEFASLHPHAPAEQAGGYRELIDQLAAWLAEITGLPAVSLQPNAGSQGEYAGLLAIRRYLDARGDGGRDVCLIPTSAHGTNPASAVMAGFRVVPVACDDRGNIDVADLCAKADAHADALGALMVTYPSTHGVFEASIRAICDAVHERGGQVYLDGANLNAQVGLCRPGDYGADVCHVNLHKTFCIPHGGGGPGMGPIAAAAHLAPYLPGDPLDASARDWPVAAARFGSPSILPISWMYIRMMGPDGLARASQVAILNANYMAARLRGHYDVLYCGEGGRVAHEFVVDCRPFKKSAGVEVEDIAKRLMDFGFHAPTMSWPVAGTLMIEPTESESRAELDRFCDALIAIRDEIRAIERGDLPAGDNPLKCAPHTAGDVAATEWPHAYRREQAAFPAPWTRDHKFWPPVSRIDNAYGDRNLMCACPPPSAFAD
ncbi:MAG: glycine dehydrogenase (aminomethyl-transferring) [Deltaproteobacteria bacterium]|nr:MAG: glycine dehydrogenase (aminomethyl-transferring) [Deltaproteobacteria bacterium]